MSGWTAHLTDKAVQDIETILDWTYEQFGPLQMDAYTGVINDALEALTEGPQLNDVRRRQELGDGVATIHRLDP
jgi:plasmid stabilization system protein ParE